MLTQCRWRLRQNYFASLSLGPAQAAEPNVGLMAPTVSTLVAGDRPQPLHISRPTSEVSLRLGAAGRVVAVSDGHDTAGGYRCVGDHPTDLRITSSLTRRRDGGKSNFKEIR